MKLACVYSNFASKDAWNGSCVKKTVSHKHISMIVKQAGIKVYGVNCTECSFAITFILVIT